MPSEVQILKESKARFEGVIFNQTADLGTNKSTSCKVIDEATGEVIAQSGGGGGDESDLTTATVTFINNISDSPTAYGAFVYSDEYEGEVTNHSNGLMPIETQQTVVATVILYKGEASIDLTEVGQTQGATISASGDATVKMGLFLLVTGDATVTISPDK